ncbi:MAG: hypothetical protein MZV70_35700 [Desulfobacterales bacterium]|nr:hypothetical protein [Desulfobacterales bacterium]
MTLLETLVSDSLAIALPILLAALGGLFSLSRRRPECCPGGTDRRRGLRLRGGCGPSPERCSRHRRGPRLLSRPGPAGRGRRGPVVRQSLRGRPGGEPPGGRRGGHRFRAYLRYEGGGSPGCLAFPEGGARPFVGRSFLGPAPFRQRGVTYLLAGARAAPPPRTPRPPSGFRARAAGMKEGSPRIAGVDPRRSDTEPTRYPVRRARSRAWLSPAPSEPGCPILHRVGAGIALVVVYLGRKAGPGGLALASLGFGLLFALSNASQSFLSFPPNWSWPCPTPSRAAAALLGGAHPERSPGPRPPQRRRTGLNGWRGARFPGPPEPRGAVVPVRILPPRPRTS